MFARLLPGCRHREGSGNWQRGRMRRCWLRVALGRRRGAGELATFPSRSGASPLMAHKVQQPWLGRRNMAKLVECCVHKMRDQIRVDLLSMPAGGDEMSTPRGHFTSTRRAERSSGQSQPTVTELHVMYKEETPRVPCCIHRATYDRSQKVGAQKKPAGASDLTAQLARGAQKCGPSA